MLNKIFKKSLLTKSSLSFLNQCNFSNDNKKIRILKSDANDIWFNLATEEYLYEQSELKCPTLFLWKNDKTVVIG